MGSRRHKTECIRNYHHPGPKVHAINVSAASLLLAYHKMLVGQVLANIFPCRA